LDDRSLVLLDQAVINEVAAHGVVLPPWTAYPDIERFSIGWRMGNGEWHLMVWWHWWERDRPDEASRIAYFRAWPPPVEWLDWAAIGIWPDLDDDDTSDPDAAVRRLAGHGIGCHLAWRTWLEEAERDDETP